MLTPQGFVFPAFKGSKTNIGAASAGWEGGYCGVRVLHSQCVSVSFTLSKHCGAERQRRLRLRRHVEETGRRRQSGWSRLRQSPWWAGVTQVEGERGQTSKQHCVGDGNCGFAAHCHNRAWLKLCDVTLACFNSEFKGTNSCVSITSRPLSNGIMSWELWDQLSVLREPVFDSGSRGLLTRLVWPTYSLFIGTFVWLLCQVGERRARDNMQLSFPRMHRTKWRGQKCFEEDWITTSSWVNVLCFTRHVNKIGQISKKSINFFVFK